MTVVAEASLLLRAQRDPSVKTALDQTQKDVRQTAQETRTLGAQSGAASAGVRQLGSSLATTGRQAQATSRQVQAAGNAAGRARATMGNLGAQVQDVAVQLQSGTDGLRVFAQQGPQILSAFGPLGAVLGSVAAVGALVATSFFQTGDEAESFEDSVSGLSEAVKNYRAIAALAGASTAELEKRYGAAAGKALEFLNAQERIQRALVLDEAQDVAEALLATYESLGRVGPEALTDIIGSFEKAKAEAESFRRSLPNEQTFWTPEQQDQLNELRRGLADVSAAMKQVRDLADDFGISFNEAEKLAAAIVRLNGAKGPTEIQESLRGVRTVIDGIVSRTPRISDGFQAFIDTVKKAEQGLLDAGIAIDDATVKTGELGDRASQVTFENAILSTRRLVEELAAARAAVDDLLDRGSASLETARIRRQFVGDPVGEAGALAGAQFDARTRGLRSPTAPTGVLVELDADRRRVVEQAREVARLDKERAAAEKALRDANRPARGGGGGRGRGETRDVAGEIARETAAIERRIEAERRGAAAIRENLILEQQEQALKRAGLTLSDLSAGAEQARAQEIARQSRALFEVRAAEEAAAEVTRAYAREIGESYGEAEERLRTWRDETLASLGAAGDAHPALAEKVEDVFRVRMAEAYREDLQRRKDWAAGVERGLNDIAESTKSMADIAEETVTTGFSKMEDAFVSLATTGKANLGDLAEFAIRQAYRIAQAYALEQAGGGGGGAGGLFGLISKFLGIGGSGSVGLSSTSPLVTGIGSFSGGAGVSDALLGFFLHGGGTRADATLRPVAASTWDNAPRLHGGGFGPGEFGAVLKDDERVLTDVQQTNTAQSIRALAQLASANMGGAARMGDVPVTVNITGAPGNAEVRANRTDQGLSIDVMFEAVEGRIGQRLASGRGPVAGAIESRYEISAKGVR